MTKAYQFDLTTLYIIFIKRRMTNIFNTLISERSPWQHPYPIVDYGRATEEIRELMVQGNHTAQVFFLDYEGNIRGGLRPTLVKINGVVDHIKVGYLQGVRTHCKLGA